MVVHILEKTTVFRENDVELWTFVMLVSFGLDNKLSHGNYKYWENV